MEMTLKKPVSVVSIVIGNTGIVTKKCSQNSAEKISSTISPEDSGGVSTADDSVGISDHETHPNPEDQTHSSPTHGPFVVAPLHDASDASPRHGEREAVADYFIPRDIR